MKIVFLQDDFPPQSFGGAGYSTYELARGMCEAGHEVSVITTCRTQEDAGEYQYEGMTVYRIASNYAPRWRAWRSIYNHGPVRAVGVILRRIEPDVVHINNVHNYLSYHCFKIARRYARAVVFTARDTMSVCYGKLDTDRYLETFDTHTTWLDHIRFAKKRYNPFHNVCVRRYLAYAHKRFAVSKALSVALMENGINDVSVMHTGARVEEWGARAEEIASFKKRFTITNKKVILFAGRISSGKGGEKVIAAFEVVAKQVPDAVLLIVGTEDESLKRMRRTADPAVSARVVVTGWVERDAVRIAYGAADVVVVPSLYLDPFPRTVIEAMASGKPVVGSCYGGSPEIIVDGVTGYVVNPLHEETIAEKTIDLLTNSQKAEQFGIVGYAHIKNDFNIEDVVKKYLSVYVDILNEGK